MQIQEKEKFNVFVDLLSLLVINILLIIKLTIYFLKLI